MNQLFTTAIRSAYAGLNPTYNPVQSHDDSWKHGSRRHFGTDFYINGEYFRSRTKNEYVQIVDKKKSVGDLSRQHDTFFVPLRGEMQNRLDMWGYDPKKHSIVLLEFSKNKGYFVESNQDIKVAHPDVIVVSEDTDIYDLLMSRPKFVPLPDSYTAHTEGL